MQIVILGLELIVDDADPVEEELVVLRGLLLRGLGGRDDRQVLLDVAERDLERFAGERHVLLGGRHVAGQPEEQVVLGMRLKTLELILPTVLTLCLL